MDELRLPLGKHCTKCGEWDLYEKFPKQKQTRDGRHSWCKSCFHEVNQARRHGPRREEILEQNRKTQKARHTANREEYRRIWREREQQPETRAKRLADKKQRYEENREYYREQARLYREANPEKWREKSRRWKENNRERHSFHVKRYRHRKRTNGGDGVAYDEWLELCEYYGDVCLCCGASGELHQDHVVPVSRGGKHELQNLQPLCGPCNSRKGTQTIDFRPDVERSDDVSSGEHN